ncbi:hypothetical protein [Cupriavidus sp. AcVe19-6a]|uniref:hypothetical protein n=1 Tax=Cupriavidus sp. AcVe19-6a TaxID=2821358 RepID=UPI001FD86CFB|nr:hypothetical protein [Cupriavidus sp. AcVe19-6a]
MPSATSARAAKKRTKSPVGCQQRRQLTHAPAKAGAHAHVVQRRLAHARQRRDPQAGQHEGSQEGGGIAIAEHVIADQVASAHPRHRRRGEAAEEIAQRRQAPAPRQRDDLGGQVVEADVLHAVEQPEQQQERCRGHQRAAPAQQQRRQRQPQDLAAHQPADQVDQRHHALAMLDQRRAPDRRGGHAGILRSEHESDREFGAG